MNFEPGQGCQYTKVSGGTSITLVSDRNTYLKGIVVAGTYVGTLALYDSATLAGTTAGNNFATLGLPALNHPNSINFDMRLRNGLVYEATGTPIVTIVYN